MIISFQVFCIEIMPFKVINGRLQTRIRLVKAVVFPVVMYGCEIWTVKKTERQRIEVLNCGVGEDA